MDTLQADVQYELGEENTVSIPKRCAYGIVYALFGAALTGATQLLAYGLTLVYQVPALAANEALQQAFIDETQQSLPSLIWTKADSTKLLLVFISTSAIMHVWAGLYAASHKGKVGLSQLLATMPTVINALVFIAVYPALMCGDTILITDPETNNDYQHCQNFANATQGGVIDTKENQENYDSIVKIKQDSMLIIFCTLFVFVPVTAYLANRCIVRLFTPRTTSERQSPLLSEGVFSSSHDVEADRQERSSSAHITPFELESHLTSKHT